MSNIFRIMQSPISRRKALQMICTLSIATAGCLSDRKGVGPTENRGTTQSPTGYLTPTESSVSEEQITDFESLTDNGQALFQTILAEEATERPSTEIPPQLWEAEYVRYNGTIYALSRTDTGSNISEYTLEVSSFTENEVDESELVNYADLTTDAKDAFDYALNQGSYTVRGDTLPGKLSDSRFVKYDGEYYKLRIMVGDVRVWEISATKERA